LHMPKNSLNPSRPEKEYCHSTVNEQEEKNSA
jgi:hypothetical protein